MADPVQIRAKEKRLAEALRANLKRRKEQARERQASTGDRAESDEPTAIMSPTDRKDNP